MEKYIMNKNKFMNVNNVQYNVYSVMNNLIIVPNVDKILILKLYPIVNVYLTKKQKSLMMGDIHNIYVIPIKY